MSDKIKLEITDHGFYSTPDDVLRQFDRLKTALKASVMLLQKNVQRRLPPGLFPRNVVTVMKPRSARVEIVPFMHKSKPNTGGLKKFNKFASDLEYKQSPYARPAFDETEDDIVGIFNVTLGNIK